MCEAVCGYKLKVDHHVDRKKLVLIWRNKIMTKTLYATYDGHVLMPEGKVDLLPNQRYLIRIEVMTNKKPKRKKKILQRLSARAVNLGISDLAAQHDHYLCGTEKR